MVTLLLACVHNYRKQFLKHELWRNRRFWVHPINETRDQQGFGATILPELLNDPDKFFAVTRMTPELFIKLHGLVHQHITCRSARKYISSVERLLITLRYLATGDQFSTIALLYRIGESTARKIVRETCEGIITVLRPIYLVSPTEDQWKEIAVGFYNNWNMPNCIGAIDGKHIEIQCPPHSGSFYFNYKKRFNIVLLAICDHMYRFTLVDIGASGSESDGGIFERSEISNAIEKGALKIPKGRIRLPGSDVRTPFFFIGDEAFRMTTTMMRPYPGKKLTHRQSIFNYRLSRARRMIESSFGLLVSRWRIFQKPINASPERVDIIVLTAVILHNFLMTEEEKPLGASFSSMQTEDLDLNDVPTTRKDSRVRSVSNTAAFEQREILADYFISSAGSVPFQYEYITRGQHADNTHEFAMEQ